MNKNAPLTPMFEADNISAVDAIGRAQMIAFAPYIWEVSLLLKDKGLLLTIEAAGDKGCCIKALAEQHQMNQYAVRVLLEAGLGIGLVFRRDTQYFLSKTGHIFLNHPMTVVNYDFMRDVCAVGAADLEASLENARPEGLKHFGNWPTIYEGLSALPPQVQKSWFAFDHFYSDNAFPEALDWVFEQPTRKILDIGGNTGRWSLKCLAYNDRVQMGIVDLPGQLNMAKANIAAQGYEQRVRFWEADMLQENSRLPEGYDVIWMSQFLDCFSEEQIVRILKKCHLAASAETRVIINETFWDKQRFETSAFVLQMTSLYFTTMANGNSQMYDSKIFQQLVEAAGFEVCQEKNLVGLGHTLWALRKR